MPAGINMCVYVSMSVAVSSTVVCWRRVVNTSGHTQNAQITW